MKNNNNEITRKEALKKIGDFSKYTALTAIGTYVMLNPKKAQATSCKCKDPKKPEDPGTDF